jgi:acrylyl-CoA reductase (NADPH)
VANESFQAWLVDQVEDRTQPGAHTRAEFVRLPKTALPEGDVLVRVSHSSLNYKDGLAVTGRGKVVRKFPMVPGIDLAGVVEESGSPDFRPGDRVIATGCGLGEGHWGGYAQLARLSSEWLLPLPQGLSPEQAMGIGTAGFTAMQCVLALEAHGCRPSEGEVVVTGASGGVGSLAVTLLSNLGYRVVASTGKTEAHAYLKDLGAGRVVERDQLAAPPRKPLDTGRWAGAVDGVGGDTLATLLSTMQPGGCITAVGLAGGAQLNTTVYPFILRAISLVGISSASASAERRRVVWSRLTRDLPLAMLERVVQVAALPEVPQLAERILAGQVRGRIVIEVD